MRLSYLSLLKYIRPLVLGFAVAIALVVLVFVLNYYPPSDLRHIRLAQVYAFLAVAFLYLALVITPLYTVFPKLVAKGILTKARRAIGVSSFFFASLHAFVASNFLLGGIAALPYLTPRYLVGIALGSVSALILALLAFTSYDRAVQLLGKRWKMLHRLVYLAALLVVIHALMLGSHFISLSGIIPQLFMVATLTLAMLQAVRLAKFLSQRFSTIASYLASMLLVFAVATLFLNGNLFSLHGSKHAEESTHSEMDENDRFNVLLINNQRILPTEPTNLELEIWDTVSKQKLTDFYTLSGQKMHFIVVDAKLNHFQHLHPQISDKISLNLTLPQDGIYKSFVVFQPYGESTQVYNFNLYVGDVDEELSPVSKALKERTETGELIATVANATELSRAKFAAKKQPITFTVAKKDGSQIEFSPYLGSFGHLTMISHYNYEMVHIHPVEFQNNRSPISFLIDAPINLRVGKYSLFFEYYIEGQLYISDFVIEIK